MCSAWLILDYIFLSKIMTDSNPQMQSGTQIPEFVIYIWLGLTELLKSQQNQNTIIKKPDTLIE